jgi:hypothetical protein
MVVGWLVQSDAVGRAVDAHNGPRDRVQETLMSGCANKRSLSLHFFLDASSDN